MQWRVQKPTGAESKVATIMRILCILSVAQVVEGMSLRKQALHDTTKNILIKPNQLFFFYNAAKQRSYE